ncbi:putative lipoprotein [hydrothermal vent metagenome]|uniref:Putative lipoprotein n=1 Tax=hydrothermal vent metagenome TaxID=652676 RepID=A0A3B0W4G9_9ZZZZ
MNKKIQKYNLIKLVCVSSVVASACFSGSVNAELNDITTSPNTLNAGIQKSLEQQVGAGRGDINTPGSSMYIIKRDPFRSVRRGRQIFQRKFQLKQGLGPRTNDGEGNLDTDGSLGAGLTDSCGGCHGRPRGSAGFGGDVFTRPDSRDAPHLFGLGQVEMLADEMTTDLRAIRDTAITKAQSKDKKISLKLKSKGTNYGQIIAFPDGSVDTSKVVGVDDDLRVKPFFAQGATISMREFIVGAFNAEMGLESPDVDLEAASAGSDVLTPAGMWLTGSQDSIEAPPVHTVFEDSDNDGVFNELDTAIIDHTEFYFLNYFSPATYKQGYVEKKGKALMARIGCTSCHTPNMTIENDRRVGNVETKYDAKNGIFNNLFATVTGTFDETDDSSGFPTLKTPQGNSFKVKGLYADFKRHDLGPKFWERNFDGTMQKEFMTEPLWGVGSTSPYGHDGRSINLHEVIVRHGGEASKVTKRYKRLGVVGQSFVQAYLRSLVLFPPDDTASNLNPGDSMAENFPQNGHGNIKLPVLFNDPTEGE